MARRYPYRLSRDKVGLALAILDYNVKSLPYGGKYGWDPDAWRHLQENVSLLAEEPDLLDAGSWLSNLLYDIRYRHSPVSLAKEWKRIRLRLEAALYKYLYNRDAPDAERARAIRDQRRLAAERLLREGRTARLTKAAQQRQRILGYARSMIDDGVARRELAGRIARKADVKRTVGHIRKILREGAVL
jgi:hypothetical protein